MPNQIIDIVELAMPGPMGDVTLAALQAVEDARAEVALAANEAHRAEVFSTNAVEFQDVAVAELVGDPESATGTTLNATIADAPIQLYGKPDEARAILQARLEAVNSIGGKVSFAGDSITEGNANGGNPWYKPWASRYPGVTLVNRGHGGKTTGDFLSDYMAELLADNADLYVIALGCNDIRYVNQGGTTGATTGAEFATNLSDIVNALGPERCVVVNPWMTTVRDYNQDIAHTEMERAYWEYDAAAVEAMAALGVPYIQTTRQMLPLYRDLTGIADWSGDGVHPNGTNGVKMYADAVLNGVPPRTKHTAAPQEALGGYVYKLEILSRAPGDTIDRVYLRKMYATPTPLDIHGSSNLVGFDNPVGLLAAYSPAYGYVNIEGDYPFVITFSTSTPLESLAYLPDGQRKGIRDYRLWVSTDREAIGQLDHSSWELLENGVRNATTYRRLLYSRFGQESDFLKLVITGPHSTDPDVQITHLIFPSNTGDKGVVGYKSSAPTTANVAQMFTEYQIPTTFTTFPANVMMSFPTSVPTFEVRFAAGRRGGGWEIHHSNDPAALGDAAHPSWRLTRKGDFGGTATVPLVATHVEIPSIPAYSTAGRPAASRFGAGRVIFDTTLGKPVYSNGSAWVDANGATV